MTPGRTRSPARRHPPRTRWLSVVLAGLGGTLLLGCCTGTEPSHHHSTAVPASGTVLDEPLPDAVATLPLVDQHGRHFTLASLRGRTVVLGDFLTLCQEVCPLTSVNLRDVAKAVQRNGRSADVQVVEATVDPGRDSVQRLAAYEKVFGAQPDWTLATGDQHGLDALWAHLGVYHEKAAEDVAPAPRDWWTGAPLTYDVHHQDVVYVIDPRGHARWVDDGTPNTLGEKPAGSLLQFLNTEGRQNLTAPADPAWTVRDVEEAVAYVSGIKLD